MSGVAAFEQVTPGHQEHGGPQAEQAESLPRREQLARLWCSPEDQRPGLHRQVGVDMRSPAAGQQAGQDRQYQDDAEDRGNGAGRVPDQRSDREGEQAKHGEVQPRPDDGPGNPDRKSAGDVTGVQTCALPILPRTVVMEPAVCRISDPIARANRPSTVRYSPAPMTARVTPGSLSATGTLLCSSVEPTKNELKETISARTSSRAANITALAASTGIRLGVARSEARITPVEYSEVITMAPSTQMVSWPR